MELCCLISYFSEGIKYILGWWNFFCFPHHICFFWGVCACTLSFLHVRSFPQVSGDLWLFKNEMKGRKRWLGTLYMGGASLVVLSISVGLSSCLGVWLWEKAGGISLSRLWLSPPVFRRCLTPALSCAESQLFQKGNSQSPVWICRVEKRIWGPNYSLHIFLKTSFFSYRTWT